MENLAEKGKIILNRKTKKRLFVIAMLAIPVIHFFVFWLWVNIDSILLVFQNNVGDWIGLENLRWVFTSVSRYDGSDCKHTDIFCVEYVYRTSDRGGAGICFLQKDTRQQIFYRLSVYTVYHHAYGHDDGFQKFCRFRRAHRPFVCRIGKALGVPRHAGFYVHDHAAHLSDLDGLRAEHHSLPQRDEPYTEGDL